MKPSRIVHLSVCRQFSLGQLNQLRYEYEASKELQLQGVEWKTIGYHAGVCKDPFIKPIPFPFRLLFLRNLYGWLIALRLSKRFDFVLMRHMSFDPFSVVFAPLIPNRVSVHHAKEVEELKLIKAGWRGKLASLIESFCGRFSVRYACVVLGVTQEIAEYERERERPCSGKHIGTYPNGIDIGALELLSDRRSAAEVHAAFICGTFSSWHGLDKLIDAVEKGDAPTEGGKVYFHLIGKLSQDQLDKLNSSERLKNVFVTHGVMAFDEYRGILERCDFGMSSFALERKNLVEASTLKVREMLALGLPVYSGHSDIALPEGVPWARVVETVALDDLIRFGLAVKSVDRAAVREQSAGAIEKGAIMKKIAAMLNSFRG